MDEDAALEWVFVGVMDVLEVSGRPVPSVEAELPAEELREEPVLVDEPVLAEDTVPEELLPWVMLNGADWAKMPALLKS